MRINFLFLFLFVLVSCTTYPMARNACRYALKAAHNGGNRSVGAPILRRSFCHAIDFDDFEKMPPRTLYKMRQKGEVVPAAPPTEFCDKKPTRPSMDDKNAPQNNDPWIVSIEFSVVSKAYNPEQVEEAARTAFAYGATRVEYYKKQPND